MTKSTPPESRMQESVFAFLTDPTMHPQVHRIDTHAASVFLEGDRALKIKRAVRFPFLDYSTLEKRKAACDEEININRQFAPQIYRRVVPISSTPLPTRSGLRTPWRRARRLNPGSNPSRHSSKATQRRSERRPAFPKEISMISTQRLSRHICGFASCCDSVAGTVTCGAAMATCIWRTLY